MGFQVKLLSFGVLLLPFLSICYGKNVTVKVIGLMHCKDCMRTDFSSSSQGSLGINVLIRCNSKRKETNTQGNGAIDRIGKFNVTLHAEIAREEDTIDGCFAELQSESSTPCPIRSPQTASINLISIEENATQSAHFSPTHLKFSPITCQSAFFWPFIKFPKPNITFSPSSPPPSYAQPPLPPAENLIPPPAPASVPSYLPRTPKFVSPSPSPHCNFEIPPTPIPVVETPQISAPVAPPQAPPTALPVVQSPPPQLPTVPVAHSPKSPPTSAFKNSPPPPLAPQVPPFKDPIPLPKTKSPKTKHPKTISPPYSKQPLPNSPPPYSNQFPPPPLLPLNPYPPPPIPTQNPYTPPPQIAHNPYPPLPLPKLEKPSPPSQRKPSDPIPRAPPVPQLPSIPKVPRKYFNPPKSESQPPQPSYPSHS